MGIPKRLALRPIRPDDSVTGLSLGRAELTPLKTFLHRQSINFHQSNIAKTYVLVPLQDTPRVWGYITLMCSQITLDGAHSIEDCQAACKYENLPAVKIARMAVDRQIQGRRYGRALVELAVSIALDEIMPKIGCRFLIVDAKPGAVEFYERTGFTLLDTEKNRSSQHPLMFMDLHKLRA